jgi:uncharacterized damage-inducible protein DinB
MSDTTALPRLALRRSRGQSFQSQSAAYLSEYLDKIRLAVQNLDDDAFWWRPAAGTNSAANLVIHLTGNLSLWVLKSIGGEEFERHRAAEFAADRSAGKDELVAGLAAVVESSCAVLGALSDDDLGRELDVQGYVCDAFTATFHAVEHMSYHTGQIIWIAKQALARRGEAVFEFYPQHAGE